MSPRNPQPDCKLEKVASAAISAGLPAWITPELIKATMEVWQPYYRDELTDLDAIEILQSTSRLFEVITARNS